MCLIVTVGKYQCGHERSPGHGIPPKFTRACADHLGLEDCEIMPNDEDIPCLCPDCHWLYVKEHFAPVWQLITITKCRVLQNCETFPPDENYRRSQQAAENLHMTLEIQQEAIENTVVAYHELHDETLKAFLGENFPLLQRAHHANRPWSLTSLQDPFARLQANVDDDASSSRSDYAAVPPPGQGGPGSAVVDDPGNQDRTHLLSDSPPSFDSSFLDIDFAPSIPPSMYYSTILGLGSPLTPPEHHGRTQSFSAEIRDAVVESSFDVERETHARAMTDIPHPVPGRRFLNPRSNSEILGVQGNGSALSDSLREDAEMADVNPFDDSAAATFPPLPESEADDDGAAATSSPEPIPDLDSDEDSQLGRRSQEEEVEEELETRSRLWLD